MPLAPVTKDQFTIINELVLGFLSEFATCNPEVMVEAPERLTATPGAPSGPSESSPTGNGKIAFSDSLSASVSASATLHILGPELFEEVLVGPYNSERYRRESQGTGAILIVGEGLSFMFRDEKVRALYVFKNIMGITWPNQMPDMEKRRLEMRFNEGWASGDFKFLAGVPFEELDFYREALAADSSDM